MGRRKAEVVDSGYVLVNVAYEDGRQTSNRKVSKSELSGFDDKGDLRTAIEAQDQKIAEMSGQIRGPITSITPVKKR